MAAEDAPPPPGPAPARPHRLFRWFLDAGSPLQLTWTWYGIAAVFSAPLWSALADGVLSGAGTPEKVTESVLILFYFACYLAGAPWAARQRVAVRAGFAAAVFATALLLILGYGLNPWTLSYAIAAAALALHWSWAIPVSGLAVTAVALADVDESRWRITFLLVIVVSIAPLRELWREYIKLESDQARLAETAVVEDRERLARELHDIVGATLTTITVKAGLARRLLEDGSPGTAAKEVRDIEELGRQALTGVRTAVSAGRPLSLAVAVSDAETALRAAGIVSRLPSRFEGVPARHQTVFAYVLREGVTNVIRHSGATHCEVRLGPTFLEVRDNGTGAAESPGRGLTGLCSRMRAIDGTLRTSSPAGGGFLLRADCPEAAP
ncbi:sensor histidine kinase [Streptosporangium roseum]|uniref:sensor histidine kinase n=1 Tax=Streptosporangium roseum TaxID=2001 RepID=UPI00333068E3